MEKLPVEATLSGGFARQIGEHFLVEAFSTSQDTVAVVLKTPVGWLKANISISSLKTSKTRDDGADVNKQ